MNTDTGFQKRRPLVGMALAAVVGCGLPSTLLGVPLLLALAAVLLAGSALSTRRLAGLVYPATALIFAIAARLQDPQLDARSLARQVTAEPVHVELLALVAGEPVASVTEEGQKRWRFPARVEALRSTGGWYRAHGDIMVGWSDPAWIKPPALGDRWHLDGLLEEANDRGVRRLRAAAGPTRCVQAGAAYPFQRACERGRAWCAGVLGRGLDAFPRDAAMLRALILGYREDLSSELFQSFSRTGALHVVAVSGSHVAIFAGILAALLRGSGLPRTRWFILLAPALILYCCSTGLAASAIRACIMALLYWGASALLRQPDGPAALAGSALALLAWDPAQVRDPGFVLSFAAVAGLMIFYPPLKARFAAEPVEEGMPSPSGAARIHAWTMPVRQLLAASVAAWLVTTPLTLHYFNLLSPIGLVLNLLAIPLAAGILFAGTLSILTAVLPAIVSESFNHAARLMVASLIGAVDRMDHWPFSHFYLADPGPWWMLGWGVALVVVFFGTARARWICLCLVAAWGAWTWRAAVTDRAVVGITWSRDDDLQSFIDLPGDADVLVDTGSGFAAREVIRGLRMRGVDRVARVVITRNRADALGGLEKILAEIPVGEIWCAGGPDRSSVARAAWAQAEGLGVTVRRFDQPATGSWAGVEWVVDPEPGTGSMRFEVRRGSARWRCEPLPGGERSRLRMVFTSPTTPEVPERAVRAASDEPPRRKGDRVLADGDQIVWRMADELTWRAGQPAFRLE